MFNIIPFIIIVVCLVALAIVVIRKFPNLSSLDVESMPQEREGNVKKQILESRIERKVKIKFSKVFGFFASLKSKAKEKSGGVTEKLMKLEKKYKKKPEMKKHDVHSEKAEVTKEERTVHGLLEMGDELVREENYVEAEKKYIEIISLDPKNIDAYRGLGNLYFLQKEYEQAKQTYQYILKLNDHDDHAYAFLGKIEEKSGDLSSAKEDYLKSLNINKEAVHFFELAEVCQKMESLDEASNYIVQALEIEPNNPKYLDFLIGLRIMMGDKEGAKKGLNALREINPENKKIEEYQEEIKLLG